MDSRFFVDKSDIDQIDFVYTDQGRDYIQLNDGRRYFRATGSGGGASGEAIVLHNRGVESPNFNREFFDWASERYGRTNIYATDSRSYPGGVYSPKWADNEIAGETLVENYDQFQSNKLAEETFREQARLGQEALDVARGIAERQADLSDKMMSRAEEREQFYKDVYRPIEQKTIAEAQVGIPGREVEGRAVADITQEVDPTKRQAEMGMAPAGIDPGSGRFQESMAVYDIARSAAEAGARGEARMGAENTTRARQYGVVSTGRGLPSEAAVMTGSAIEAAGGAGRTSASAYGAAIKGLGNVGGIYSTRAQNALQRATDYEIAQRKADNDVYAARMGAAGQVFGSIMGNTLGGI